MGDKVLPCIFAICCLIIVGGVMGAIYFIKFFNPLEAVAKIPAAAARMAIDTGVQVGVGVAVAAVRVPATIAAEIIKVAGKAIGGAYKVGMTVAAGAINHAKAIKNAAKGVAKGFFSGLKGLKNGIKNKVKGKKKKKSDDEDEDEEDEEE